MERVSKKEIFLYSFGGVGANIGFIFVMSFLTMFFVTALKMNEIVVGTIFLVARLVDAITDPIMGVFADKCVTKIGKYRPFIIGFAPMVAITVMMLFYPISLISNNTTQIIFAYVAYIAYSLASTGTNIPYHAATLTMTDDINQRSSVFMGKTVGAFVGSLIPGVLTIPLIKFFSKESDPNIDIVNLIKDKTNIVMNFGDTFPDLPEIVPNELIGTTYNNEYLLLDSMAWFYTAVVMGVMMMVAFLICQYGAKDKDTYERALNYKKGKDKLTFKNHIKVLFFNKPLILLMIAFLTDLIAFGMASGLNVFFWSDVIGNSSYVSIITFGGLLARIPFIILLPFLIKRYSKKRILMSGAFLTSFIYFIIYSTNKDNILLLLVLFIIANGTALIPSTMGWSMLMDCATYAEYKHGIHGDGTVVSGLVFVNKIGMALGGFASTMALVMIGFNNSALIQNEVTLKGLVTIRTIMPILGYLCSLVAMMFYDLDDKKVKEMYMDSK